MIINDTSQLVIASALNEAGYSKRNSAEDNKNLIKHIFFNTIRYYKIHYGPKYGKMVFAVDAKKYWRKDFCSYYKGTRKNKRDTSDFDWELIFEIKNELIHDIDKYFPYDVIQVDGAEADDIIAVLSRDTNEPTLIVSSDRDLKQLQSPLVIQYCPRKKKMLELDVDINDMVFEHIIRGDTGDGIPNIKSPINSLVDKIRQKSITESFVSECKQNGIPKEFLDRFEQNKKMIDLTQIPDNIVQNIRDYYKNLQPKQYDVFGYFASHGFRNLLTLCGDF